MPKVSAFSVAGLVLRFFSHDHLPPHFHAEKPGRWEVKVRFRLDPADMIEVVSKKKPRPAELKELKRLAEEHRAALLIEWETMVQIHDPVQTGDTMSEAVEILAPTNPEKLKRVIGSTPKTSFVKKPSKTRRERIVVGWLSDLDSAKHRKELVDIVDLVVGGSDGVPLVLIEAKAVKAPSYAALETLTRWAARFGAYLAPDEHAVRRMVNARLAEAEDRLIASALIEGDKLVVWSCEPRRYAVPVSDISALARINPKHLSDFELNESGSCLHWDEGDVDLNLDGIRYYVDPKARKEQDRASREEAARYAGAIRTLRKAYRLAQTDIPGLTERQVRRVEQGESTPRSGTLKKLAAAHGMALDQYLKELAKRSRSRR